MSKWFPHKKNLTREHLKMLNDNYKKSELNLDRKVSSLDNTVQFEIDRENKRVSCIYADSLTSRIDKLLEHVVLKTENNERRKAYYPIFITSRLRRAGTNETHGGKYTQKLKIWCKEIRESLIKRKVENPNERFMIFLFIEGGREDDRLLFSEELEYYRKLCDEEKGETGPNPIVLCYWPERNLGVGRKRKIMQMFADHLNLRRVYFLDDDIDQFLVFDPRYFKRDYVVDDICNSLDFMLDVMDHEITQQSLKEFEIEFETDNINKLLDEAYVAKSEFNDSLKIFQFLRKISQMSDMKEKLSSREELLTLLCATKDCKEEIWFKIKEKFSGKPTNSAP